MERVEETVSLKVGGVEWTGWKSCQVARGVENLAGTFALGLASRTAEGSMVLPIAPGMDCVLSSNGDPICTGWVDSVQRQLTSSDHSIQVDGRDKTCDLVDCSAVHSPGAWKGMSLSALIRELCAPFGIEVALEGDEGAAFKDFKINPGETVAAAMQRLLKQRELLAVPDGRGGLRLANIGGETHTGTLREGLGVLESGFSSKAAERFSDYIVDGQKKGTDDSFGEACSVRGEVKDPEITRYRPMLIRSGQQGEAAYMRQRAQWEMTTRKAKGTEVKVKVQGWRDEGGTLWTPGWLVSVDLPTLEISQDLLIADVTLTKSMDGTTADLTLKDPDAFQPEPAEPEKKGGGGGKSSGGSGGTDWSLYVKQAQAAKKAGEAPKEAL